MNDIKIDKGELFDLLIEDTEATKAEIRVSVSIETNPIIKSEANFTDGKAQISLLKTDTDQTPGEYIYQIFLYDEDNEYIVLDGNCKNGVCTVAKFTICPIIPEGA